MVRQVEKDDIRGDDGRVFRDSRCFQNGQIVAGVPPFEGKRWYFLHRVRGEPCTDFFGAPPKDRVFVQDPMLENQIKSQVRTYREQRRADAEARRAMAVAEAKAAKEAREAKDHMRLLQAGLDGDTLRHRLQSAGHMRHNIDACTAAAMAQGGSRGRQGGSRGSAAPPNNDRAMWDQIRAQQAGHRPTGSQQQRDAGRDRWAEAAGFGRGRGVRPPPEVGEGTIGDVALRQTLAPGAPNAFVYPSGGDKPPPALPPPPWVKYARRTGADEAYVDGHRWAPPTAYDNDWTKIHIVRTVPHPLTRVPPARSVPSSGPMMAAADDPVDGDGGSNGYRGDTYGNWPPGIAAALASHRGGEGSTWPPPGPLPNKGITSRAADSRASDALRAAAAGQATWGYETRRPGAPASGAGGFEWVNTALPNPKEKEKRPVYAAPGPLAGTVPPVRSDQQPKAVARWKSNSQFVFRDTDNQRTAEPPPVSQRTPGTSTVPVSAAGTAMDQRRGQPHPQYLPSAQPGLPPFPHQSLGIHQSMCMQSAMAMGMQSMAHQAQMQHAQSMRSNKRSRWRCSRRRRSAPSPTRCPSASCRATGRTCGPPVRWATR